MRSFRYLLWPSTLQVVFHEKYSAGFPEVAIDALRAERILAFLAAEKLVHRRAVLRPEPASLKTLGLVHTLEYLDAAQQRQVLTSTMGAEITPDQIDRLLDFQRLQTGGTLLAIRRALDRGLAINLGGGFHHAHASQGGGFCVFNDIAVAIAVERSHHFLGKVLVVDLDLHDGDGTRDIFRHDESVHTFSVHARHWGETEAVESTSLALGSAVTDEAYLQVLREHLPQLFERFKPELVIFVAGVDPAHDDRLGSWRISAAGMLARDRLVFSLSRTHGAALAILLAGGYGSEAWRYTARFLSEVERPGRPIEPPATETMTVERYRHLARMLPAQELSGGKSLDEFGFSEDDLQLPGMSGYRESRFLGFYTKHGIELALERTGFLDRLRELGFANPILDLQLDDPAGQTLRIFGDQAQRELLAEMRLLRDRRSLPGFELLSIEWLLLQNPRLRFDQGRPPLPGQKHPGLGMLDDVVALLIVACDRLHLDGLICVPSEFHVAAYGRSHLQFVDPALQVRFEALLGLFRGQSLARASQTIADGRVRDGSTGEILRWRPEPMILAVSPRLEALIAERRKTPFEWREYQLEIVD